MYSSIEEDLRKIVIDQCYWPLLELANKNYRIGLEASALSLEIIDSIDSQFLKTLRMKIQNKEIEFIGSGYSQIIAPLVPKEVNRWNLKLAQDLYSDLINCEPKIWFINEQAYSKGLLQHYVDLKATAIIQEYNNSSLYYDPKLRQLPQVVTDGTHKLPIIWNDSITFQRFQRLIHGEFTFDEFILYLNQIVDKYSCHCLYGGDLEIFNFRPGRYKDEAKIYCDEWERIKKIFTLLMDNSDYSFIFPSEALRFDTQLKEPIRLESPESPIPVKKQPKYNVTRWGVTGRNSPYINKLCYELCNYLKLSSSKLDWKRLCYFFSSDFRTHITQLRWDEYLKELESTVEKYRDKNNSPNSRGTFIELNTENAKKFGLVFVELNHRLVKLGTKEFNLTFNRYRGAAIESVCIDSVEPIGTIQHGFYREMGLSADWYSSNIVFKESGKIQITDLNLCEKFRVFYSENMRYIKLETQTMTDLGLIQKDYLLDLFEKKIDIRYVFVWDQMKIGSLRIHLLTMKPKFLNKQKSFYATHNGGFLLEDFDLNSDILHCEPASYFVTASSLTGMTENKFHIGDDQKLLEISLKESSIRPLPMLLHRNTICGHNFTQLIFSLAEVDESYKFERDFKNIDLNFEIRFYLQYPSDMIQ
jgi:hypothetical protein